MFLLSTAVSGDLAVAVVNLGIIILAGMFTGRLFEALRVPAITGYLVAGLVLGPITHIISLEDVFQLSIISDIALGFIAFQVGNELWFGKLKKSGSKIAIITIVQALITTGLVVFITQFFVSLPIALVLGAIAAATSPAEIMMLNKKYKTKGELTDTILPVVGLDDAVGVILFSVLLSIAMSMFATSSEGLGFLSLLHEPFLELLKSIGIGIVIGLISGFAVRNITLTSDRNEKSLNVVVITVFLTTGAAMLFGASPILTPMIAGTVVTNLINKEYYVLEEETIRFFIPPIMVTFFTLAGAQLQFQVIAAAGLAGLAYIIGRTLGKFGGAFAGASLVKSSPKVKKYLGIGLLPQSGVAIGLSIATFNTVSAVNYEAASIIQNIILAAVLVFALTGPVLVKLAYFKAGENTVSDPTPTKKDKQWKNTPLSQH